jgi:hypothetical protein
MDKEVMDSEIKTRIPIAYKKALAAIAAARHLKLADILREAIREKIQGNLERTNGR